VASGKLEGACSCGVFLEWPKMFLIPGLPVFPVFEEDKIPREIKTGYEAQSRPWIMKGE
jgi:hypothetical protein